MSRSGGVEQPAASPLRGLSTFLSRMHMHYYAKSPNMSNTTLLEREQTSFEASQTQVWSSIRQRHTEVETAASRIKTINTEPQPAADASHLRALSPLEWLPEEILVSIMERLDHESLYRLSQTTGHFLRLSFDSVFETDPAWRAFRHTVDGLSDGPSRRILDGIKCEIKNSTSSQDSKSRRASLPPYGAEPGKISDNIQKASEKDDAEFGADSGYEEGETMLEFMARRS
ncbi:hypothetical protein F5Y19DRAFT_112061 [Xylariaceae sp. FL1651]|nr:hypothetical protein F5Y19DRAFT_112061 [Xylariaceae sp. FL1651]